MRGILPIVEGEGDQKAVPYLIRRILHEVSQDYAVQVLTPHKRGDLPKVRRQFERWYETALLEDALVLWVMDFDCADCVDHEAAREALLTRARKVNPSGVLEVVFMVKEFESIFLHDDEALRIAFPELSSERPMPRDPEGIRNAKGWISDSLPRGRAYKETVDQARLCHHIDLDRVRQASASYARFEAAVRALLTRNTIHTL